MNNTYRFASALGSIALLALGFVRAAEHLDPMASKRGDISENDSTRFSWQCVPCDFA